MNGQQTLTLDAMTPEDRKAAEAMIAGKPQLTMTKESIQIWNALSPADQEVQLAAMTEEQREAIKRAVAGEIASI